MNKSVDDPLELLGEKHVLGIIAFLAENQISTKTEIYEAVSRSARMPDKLEALKENGLIDMNCYGNTGRTAITLTDKGRRVADLVLDLRREPGY